MLNLKKIENQHNNKTLSQKRQVTLTSVSSCYPSPDFCKSTIETEIGTIVIVADNCRLNRLFFPPRQEDKKEIFTGNNNQKQKREHPVITETGKQLKEYFQKKRRYFDMPISLHGTHFQHTVWLLLSAIPHGKTASYGSLAEIIGDRNKARAVGGAAHLNPLPIIIPCHRLIGSNGRLTGFAGGLAMKKLLLQLEGYLPPAEITKKC